MRLDRIAFNPGSLLSMEEVLSFAKLADKNKRIDSLWIPESWGREAFASLGAISQVTRGVKLGTAIINVYSRTPATIAMAATTLDMLSGNRAIIGLGASTPAIVENFHGIQFVNPVGRMREYIECIRAMLKGEKVNYNGEYVKVKDFKLLYKPQRQGIPIFVACVNANMVSLASNMADGVLLYLRPLEELKDTVIRIKSSAQHNKSFEISCVFICAVSNREPEKARARAAKTLAFYISVGKYYRDFLSENGFRNETEQIASEYWHKGLEAASSIVPEGMLDSLTICGTADECAKSLDKFMSTGITLPIIQINPIGSAESSIREMLTTF
jgi:alkanesulfonate monooxygenase SsuD/methylene tetrahydromethanopterin reductase-like flavin-dependent oxidoreductase (luciferase family)